MKITAKLIEHLPEQSGEGRNGKWFKHDFIVETFGDYPKKICCTAWNERIDNIASYSLGTPIEILVSLESKKHQERWFTEVKCLSVKPLIIPQEKT